MSLRYGILISVLAFSFTGSFSFAEHHELSSACMADAQQFCTGEKKGEGLGKCMRDHKEALSTECKADFKSRMGGAVKACHADVKKFCKGVERGEGRIAKCLKSNEAHLSANCKDKVNDHE